MLDELVGRAAFGAEVLPGVRVSVLSVEILVTRLSSTVTAIPHAARQYRDEPVPRSPRRRFLTRQRLSLGRKAEPRHTVTSYVTG